MSNTFKIGDVVETVDNTKSIIKDIFDFKVQFPYIVKLEDNTHDYYKAEELRLSNKPQR